MFRWFFVLVMLCLLLLTLPAWGGEEERAYSLFEEGVRAYERGDLRTAWTRFREALEIFWRLGLEGEAALHPAAKMALILVCSYKLLPLQQGLRFPPNEGALPNFEPTSLY